MRALLNCCQRSSAVQPHSLLPPTAATTDTPPVLLQKESQAEASAIAASAPLQQQDDVQRVAIKAEGAAGDAQGGATGGAAELGEKGAGALGQAAAAGGTIAGLSAATPAHATVDPAAFPEDIRVPLEADKTAESGGAGAAVSTAGVQAALAGRAPSGGGTGGGTAAFEAGAPETEEGKKTERAGTGVTEKQQGNSEPGAAAEEPARGEGGGTAGGGGAAAEENKTAAGQGDASPSFPGGGAGGAEPGGAALQKEGEAAAGGGGDGVAARESDGVRVWEGGEEGGGPQVRPRQTVTLEDMLEKKWKQLQHYLEEEQLFKAYQYLLLLEQQVEHRLALVIQALHSFSPAPRSSNAEQLQGGGALVAGRGGGERGSSRHMSLQQQQQTGGDAVSGVAAAGAWSHAGSTGKNRQKDEQCLPSEAQQSRLAVQERALCDFQKRLVSEQTLKNLRTQMTIFHQMLTEFHLDHLLQACEEPRLSCCESLVSTADENEQPLQQEQTDENMHRSGGEGEASSRDGAGARGGTAAAGGGGGESSRDAVGTAAGKGGRSGRADSRLLQHRGSGGSSWSQSKGGGAAAASTHRAEGEGISSSSAGTAGKDGSASPENPAAAPPPQAAATGGGGGVAAGQQEEPSASGPAAALLSERRLSSSKTFRQGLRSVVGRKMSFGRRSGNFSKRSAVKKVVTARKKQDDEGWLRERGHCLDLAYRVEKDSSVSMKVRGKLPCMLFQVLAILNETDLAASWAPFFKSAEKEYQYTKASQLVRQVYDYPLLGSKETLMFCVGVNALEEGGCVCIFCRSPPENATEFMGLPVPPPGVGPSNSSSDSSSSKAVSRGSWVGGGSKVPRIQSADLVFLLFPISEGRQTTLELFGNFHHGLRFVPMRLITFVVKKIVRSMFVSIARQCQQFQTGPYKERVEKDPVFYGWMERKIEEYVQQKRKLGIRHAFAGGTDSAGSLASFNYEEFQD